jgi:hypothetical protein
MYSLQLEKPRTVSTVEGMYCCLCRLKGTVLPAHAMKALDGSEWSASRPGHFAHGESIPSRYPFNTRLGGGENKFGCFENRKIPRPYQESNHDISVVQPVG